MARGKEVMGRLRAEGRHTKRELQAQVKNSNFWVTLVNTAALIAFYYSSSIGLTFYQSWLMKELRFPLTIVLCHFVMKFCMGWACRAAYTMHTGLQRVALPWSQMLGRVAVVAVVASLDIGLSQWSFEYIDVALYTITKSTSIVFILMWAILLRLEKKHWSLVVIVVMIATGLAMFTYKSTDFVMVGFVMVLSASFLSGVRWTVSQLIMQRAQYNLSNPVDMIYHVQPMMILAILPFTVAIEGSRVATSVSMLRYTSLSTFLQTTALVAVGGVIAFVMEVGEYLLVSYTSSLTLSVAGICKEIISMALAIVFQATDVSAINVVGLVVCMTGVSLHVLRKAMSLERVQGSVGRKAGSPGSGEALLSGSDTDSDVEVFHTSRANREASPHEETFLKEHRQWTGVRDSHLAAAAAPPSAATADLSAAGVEVDHQIVDLSPAEPDALDEADQLLQQLDLLSSD